MNIDNRKIIGLVVVFFMIAAAGAAIQRLENIEIENATITNSSIDNDINISYNDQTTARELNSLYWNNNTFPVFFSMSLDVDTVSLDVAEAYLSVNNEIVVSQYVFDNTQIRSFQFSYILPAKANYSVTAIDTANTVYTPNFWYEGNLTII